MQAYADYILETSNGSFVASHHAAQGTHVETLRDLAPIEQTANVEAYVSPFSQIDAVVVAGGGELSLDNSGFKAAVLPIMEFCTSISYTID
ncbi:hypothetical protein ASE14_15350 [Agromyces sp. Root81]|nr:hypothetical protein ASE14_15350 [Agromyces sp. Root81]